GGERDDGHAQRFGGFLGGGCPVGVAYPHVDRRAEGDGDQQDEDEGLPGEAARPLRRRCGAVAHGGRVVGDAFLGGELLEAGSTDEGLVEDDGPVLVLATPGGALGGPLGWVRRPCHTFR